jgi:hypothetical protein
LRCWRRAEGNKGKRSEIEGKTIVGVRDEFRPDGGERRRFQTLWFRTYRYVQLEIETADEPLRIHDLHGIFVGYSLKLVARFGSDLPWLAEMWEMNWRTVRLGAGRPTTTTRTTSSTNTWAMRGSRRSPAST